MVEEFELQPRVISTANTSQPTIYAPPNATHSAKPKPNSILTKLTLFTILGGFLFGYDTGVISSALLLIEDDYKFTTIQKELIVTITLAFAALFALIAGPINRIIGRKKSIIGSSVLFGIGSLVLFAAPGFQELLAGRAIVGMGLGISSTVVPIYLSECAPRSIRGKLNTANQISITFGEWVAALLGGIVSKFDFGWRFLLGAAVIPAGIQMMGFLCTLPESPRYLLDQGRKEEAAKALSLIRGEDSYPELATMSEEISRQSHMPRGMIIRSRSGLKALILACSTQLIAQFTGINTIMYYAGSIVFSSGVVINKSAAIWIVLGIISVHFASSFVGFFTIDRFGRRPLILTSLLFTIMSLWILSIGSHLNRKFESSVVSIPSPNSCGFSNSSVPTKCSDCSSIPSCGYCANEDLFEGYCSLNCTTGHLWIDNCPSNSASVIPVIGMILYLMSFSPGLGPVPWAIGSEVFPQSVRDTGMGIAVFTHWAANCLISVTFLSLIEVIGQASVYLIYSVVGVLSTIFLYFFLPETKGLPLEQVPELLDRPWFVVRRSKYTRFE